MPPSPLYLPTVAPSTVEQAINAMIVAGGEGPIAGSVVHRPDREAAASLLEEALKEVLTEGWTFNTEHGLEIGSNATISWLGSDGTTEVLNIFEPPQNLLSFKVTQSREQVDLDFIVRPPRDWLGGPQVFYDRVLNRDGYADRTSLYIDPTWLMDYEDIPQTARNVVFLRALRRFLTQIVGDFGAADRKERDELLAFRNLKKEFGAEDRYNLFGNLTTARHFGFRFFDQSTVDDRRGNRSGAVGGAGYRVVDSVDVTPNPFSLVTLELEDALQVPASISLRKTEVAFRLSNPNSGDVEVVQVTPAEFTITALNPLPVPGSIVLAADQVNLLAPSSPAETVATVEVSPSTFSVDATNALPVPGSMLLLSNSVSLSTSAPSFSMTAFLIDNSVINPGQARNGTVSITRVGSFAGAVTVSSTDGRVSFPNGTTIPVGQSSLAFVYTVPVNAGAATVSVPMSATAAGVSSQGANFTATIGVPSFDVSLGSFPSIGPGSSGSATLQLVRTNFNGVVTVTATRPMNPTFSDRQNNINGSTAWIDVAGNNVTPVSGTINGGVVGFSAFASNASEASVLFSVPNGLGPGTYGTTLTFTAPGLTTIQRSFNITVTGEDGGPAPDPAVTVTQVVVAPSSFTLDATQALPIPTTITVGTSEVTLSLS